MAQYDPCTVGLEEPRGFCREIQCYSLQLKVECNFYFVKQSLHYDLEAVPLMILRESVSPSLRGWRY